MTVQRDVLVFIHGMTQETDPGNHQRQYHDFFKGVCAVHPVLEELFSKNIYVEWGHEPLHSPQLRPDQRIARAEQTVYDLSAYKNVKRVKDRNNRRMHDFTVGTLLGLQALSTKIREKTVIFGLGDVIYYCGPDGEAAVREAVYGQVLEQLKAFRNENVRLHVIAHSIGCTVAFDFLYGLFAPSSYWTKKRPDFCANKKYGKQFLVWRKKQQRGELTLGSKTSMASQLPILLLRKQKVADMLHAHKRLNARVIGLTDSLLRWKIFYDIDDILAFPTRNLFEQKDSIMDVQVHTGILAHTAHSNYWKNKCVIEHTAALLAETAVR